MNVIHLLHTKMQARWLRILLLAFGVGIALLPLAVLLLRDVDLLPVFSALLVLTLLLVLWEEGIQPHAQSARLPPTRAVAAPQDQRESHPLTAGPSVEQLAAFLSELTVLDDEITRLCERLALVASAPAPQGARLRPVADVAPPQPLLLEGPNVLPSGWTSADVSGPPLPHA